MRLVDYKTAKMLQELGYDGECKVWYDSTGNATCSHNPQRPPAPRLDDAAYWLREKHDHVINVFPCPESEVADVPYIYEIHHYEREGEFWEAVFQSICHTTYENALEAAIKTVLKMINE